MKFFGEQKENDNVNKFLKSGQFVVTPKAEKEKQFIDDELCSFLEQGKSVKNFNVDLKYNGQSIVPSKIIISASIDGTDYNKVVAVW